LKKWTKILIAIIIILAIIQIPVFTPKKNYATTPPAKDIATAYNVPMNVLMNLNNSCYDCHSNYTQNYYWYYHVQPVSWWMNLHIKEAKENVNFSEFADYTPKQAAHKFNEIQEQMDKKKMPLKSYLLMHGKAKMTDQDYKNVADWARQMQDSIIAKHPEIANSK